MIKKTKQNFPTFQPGATSLLITVAVGMMLMVIIAGIAAFSIREQRQSTNTDQSNRALLTAEAGVKDAVQKLSTDPNTNQTSCQQVGDIFPDQPGQAITCRTITSQFSDIQGFIERDRATQIQILAPNPTLAANSMQLRWHSNTLDKTTPPYAFNGQFYPPSQNYNSAAAIELTFVYWKRGQLNSTFLNDPANQNNGLRIVTRYLMPGQADKANSNVSSGCSDQSGVTQANMGAYRCVTNPASSVGFNIKDALSLPDAPNLYDYVVKIKPRYADTHFEASFFNSDNEKILVQSTKALIDVTARSGDLYRRVQAEKPIIPTSLENLFDSVLFTGRGSNDLQNKNICKNLVVNEKAELVRDSNCNN